MELLTENSILNLYNKLYPCTQVDEIARAQHIKNIHQNLHNAPIHKSQQVSHPKPSNTIASMQPEEDEYVDYIYVNEVEEESIDQMIVPQIVETPQQQPQTPKCPKCNGKLVIRTATKGVNAGNQFYGCSNYPKCKYTRNVRM